MYLHGDAYFDRLDNYFKRIEEYSILPRNKQMEVLDRYDIDYQNKSINELIYEIEDILNVDGIGESIYVNIKKNITV